MITRALWYTVFVGVVSMTSGCYCFHECFPNVGWRLHQGAVCRPCAPACGPVCSPCAPGPAFRPPMIVNGPIVPGPDCPGCGMGAPPTFNQPAGYPPVIGKPMPIPGMGNELPNPMPVNPKTGN